MALGKAVRCLTLWLLCSRIYCIAICSYSPEFQNAIISGHSRVTLAMLMAAIVDAKIYERCELALKLERAGLNSFKGYTVGDWLCMAHYESGFDTSFVDHNPDGSSEYGIFQLNSAWWCDNGITPTQNLCHMDCRDLLNRHLLDDILCARQVVSSQNGMTAWDSWIRHCYGHDLSEWLKGCNMHAKHDSKKIKS